MLFLRLFLIFIVNVSAMGFELATFNLKVSNAIISTAMPSGHTFDFILVNYLIDALMLMLMKKRLKSTITVTQFTPLSFF